METHFHPDPLAYDGSAIRSHWARRSFGLAGDAAVAFIGPCDVKPSEVADMEEVISGEPIRAARMVHFVAEHFGPDLESAVLRLHLLAALAFERLVPSAGKDLRRDGDDLYLDRRKLSVGVATATPVSVKIHFGVNVSAEGVPVPAAGLCDLSVEPEPFALSLLGDYSAAVEAVAAARAKVRGVD